GQNIRKFVESEMDESKISDTIGNERKVLDTALSFVLQAEQAADQLHDDELKEKTKSAIIDAESVIHKIESNLNKAKRALHAFKLHARREDHTFARDLYRLCVHDIEAFEKVIKGNKLDVADPDWARKVGLIKTGTNTLIINCGTLHTKIQDYINKRADDIRKAVEETRKRKSAAATAGSRTP
ncbi:MAG: hypothetical protein KJ896_03435, partial [Nanoarchaeota archaeon]|nr:hypothetical protein [Nanoarchaeota archaeon]